MLISYQGDDMSKAKSIGTRAESAVRNYLLSTGYTELEAHRQVLAGSDDQGDVWLRDPKVGLVVFEVKGGDMAKKASAEQCAKWLDEAERERKNARAAFGFLVTQRAGVGYPRAGEWWAYVRLRDLFNLYHSADSNATSIVRISLKDLVKIIRGER
jgi:hypothetical protein